MTSKNSKNEANWGETPKLTPEQIITWLEGHRAMMWEIWKNNPGSRLEWERINHQPAQMKPQTKEK